MPRSHELREAVARFEALLSSSARESDYQRLFTENPFVLSRTLPLRVEPGDIRPLGRPGRSEPDLIVFPQRPGPIPQYGVIELKRPDSPILVERRKGLLLLSADAQTAFEQGRQYRQELVDRLPISTQHSLIVGNPAQVFVIMGLSSELHRKLEGDLRERELERQLPRDCRLIPYDTLLAAFRATVPPQLTILVPRWTDDFEALVRHLETQRFDWRIFEVTDCALTFWEEAQRRAERCSAIATVFQNHRWFRAQHGISAGSIASESPAHVDFPSAIDSFLAQMVGEAARRGIQTKLDLFIKASVLRWQSQRDRDLSRLARAALLQAVDECETRGRSYAYMDYSSPAVRELERRGLVAIHSTDGGEFLMSVHPVGKHLT